MLIRMPAPEHIELPNPRRLLRTTAWSMAESVGLPFGTYVAVTDLVSPDAGLLAGTAVVWLLIVARRIVTGSVTSLLMISAVVLTIQTAVAVSTGYLWMFQLQFPLANLAMCLVFARTAPTRKPLVAQLAAEVVAFKQSEDHHPGLHRFFQGATWFWAGLFLLLTLGMAVMMKTEPFKLFMLLSSVVTLGLTALGAGVCALWFFAVLRRLGLGLRFAAVLSVFSRSLCFPARCTFPLAVLPARRRALWAGAFPSSLSKNRFAPQSRHRRALWLAGGGGR